MPSNLSISNSKFSREALLHRFTLRQVFLFLILFLSTIEIYDQVQIFLKHRHHPPLPQAAAGKSHEPTTFQLFGMEYSTQKEQGTYRILIFGGSAATGFVSDYRKSWWYLLQESLREKMHRKVEIINFAQGALTSADDYVLFMKDGRRLNADLVIDYSGWNDIAAYAGNPGWIKRRTDEHLAEIGKKTSGYRPSLEQSPLSVLRRCAKMKKNLERNISFFYAWLEGLRSQIILKIASFHLFPVDALKYSAFEDKPAPFQQVMAEDNIQADYISTYPLYKNEIRKLYSAYYKKNLEAFAEELAKDKIPGIFVFQPDLLFTASKRMLSPEEEKIGARLLGLKNEKWKEIVKEFYPLGKDLMRHAAENRGLVFFDMDKTMESYPGEKVFQDNVHYNEEGNKVVADEMLKMIQDSFIPQN